jgi:preprotein translocase subunit SecD
LNGWTQGQSGNSLTWTIPVAAQNTLKDQATEQALKIIESRINAYGVKEPTLQRQGGSTSGQILLQMPGVDDPERVKALIGSDSHLMR